jgi:hypothetical protein
MRRRSAALTPITIVLVVGGAGCSQPEIRSEANASVTIDGIDQGRTSEVTCSQLQSSWFLDIRQVASSVTAIVDRTGDKASAETVDFRGFGGFTGSYWQGGAHTADATFANQTFTISGTASGVRAGSPKPVTATFKIVARC